MMECDTQLIKLGCTNHASSGSSWVSKRRRPTSSSFGGADLQLTNPNPKRRKLVRPTFDKPSPSCNGGFTNDGHKDKGSTSRDDALHLPVPDDTNTIEQQHPLLVCTHGCCDTNLRADPLPMAPAAADATSSGGQIAPLLVQHNTAIEELRTPAVGLRVPSTCAPEPEPEPETFADAQRDSCIISNSDHQSLDDDLTRAIEQEYAARFPPLLFDDDDDFTLSDIDTDSDNDDDGAFIQRLHAMFHPTSS